MIDALPVVKASFWFHWYYSMERLITWTIGRLKAGFEKVGHLCCELQLVRCAWLFAERHIFPVMT